MRNVLSLILALLLAACGPRYAHTPEPGDTAAAETLMNELGTEMTWDKRTLLPNKPDGLVLKDWLARREATLDGTLRPQRIPATFNPGRISRTLEWERQTEREEGARVAAHDRFVTFMQLRAASGACRATLKDQQRWYEQAKRNFLAADVWKTRTAQYDKSCADETNRGVTEFYHEQERRSTASQLQRDALQACEKKYGEANLSVQQDVYASDREERFKAVADEAGRCEAEAKKRFPSPPPTCGTFGCSQ